MTNHSTNSASCWWGENIQLAQGIHYDILKQQEDGDGSPSSSLLSKSSCLIWPPHQSIQPFDILLVIKSSPSQEVTIGPSVLHYMNRSDVKRMTTLEEERSTKKMISLSSSTYQMLLEECFNLITTNQKDAGDTDAVLSFKHVETQRIRLTNTKKEEDDEEEESVEQIIENALEGMEFFSDIERLYVVTSVTSALGVSLRLPNHKKIDLLEAYGRKKQHYLLPSLAITSNSVKLLKQRHVPVTIAIDAIPFHLVNGRLSRLKHHVGNSSRNLKSFTTNENDYHNRHEQLLSDLCGCTFIFNDALPPATTTKSQTAAAAGMMRPPLISSASVPVLNSNNGNHYHKSGVVNTSQSRPHHNTNVKIKQALLIGNNRYLDSSLPSLRGCHDDVRSMNKYLSRQGFSIDMKLDLGFDDIMGSLANLALEHHAASLSTKDANSSSVIVLYFAGYGRRRRISDIVDPVTGTMEYEDAFVPIDSCSTSTPANDREHTTAPTSEETKHDNNEEEGNVKILGTTADDKVNTDKTEISNTIENKDISLKLLKEWINQNFSSETTHVMILWDCGGCYDAELHNNDPDSCRRMQSRALPSDDRPPSKQQRPNAIVGAGLNTNNDTSINNHNNIVVVRSCRVYETSMETCRQDVSPPSLHSTSQAICSGPSPKWNGVFTNFLLQILQNDTYRDIHSSYFNDLLNYMTQTDMMTITTSKQKSTRSIVSSTKNNDEQHHEQHLQISASASISLNIILQTLLYSPLKHTKAMNSPKTHLKELRLTAKTQHSSPRSQPSPPPPIPHVNDC